MHIAIITAGGAGMFCGSCMHDNTWAHALMNAGHEVSLLPTYTPIRVDEANHSDRRVFFGGINVYAEYCVPWLWGRLPRVLTRWLDAPWAIGLATRFGVSNNADHLGALTLAMLDGEQGPQRREIEELVDFLANQLKPDAIIFSNALLVGAVRTLKARYAGPVFCMLQGDDIFLEDLPEPYRTGALDRIHERAQQFDGFLVHSRYYRDFMAGYLDLPVEKFHLLPLGIDFTGHDGIPQQRDGSEFTVGYFARICPEKGLHQLVDAFRILRARHKTVRLRAGGYLGKRDQKYFRQLCRGGRDLGDSFEYTGSPETHAEKVAFLKSLDVLSVPTVYREPKGLYVLEALANGIPVVQPRHGSFPELIEATGGGLLITPGNAEELASALESLMLAPAQRLTLARDGHTRVRERFGEQALVDATLAALSAHAPREPAETSLNGNGAELTPRPQSSNAITPADFR